MKRLCQKLAVVFQRVCRLILASEYSDPSLVVSGHVCDWEPPRQVSTPLTILFLDTSTKAVYVSRTGPQTKTSMLNNPRRTRRPANTFSFAERPDWSKARRVVAKVE